MIEESTHELKIKLTPMIKRLKIKTPFLPKRVVFEQYPYRLITYYGDDVNLSIARESILVFSISISVKSLFHLNVLNASVFL